MGDLYMILVYAAIWIVAIGAVSAIMIGVVGALNKPYVATHVHPHTEAEAGAH